MKMCVQAVKAIKEAIDTGEIASHIEEYDGICFACGAWKYGECEPDARNYKCDECGARAVYGTEESLLYVIG